MKMSVCDNCHFTSLHKVQ